MPGKTNTWPTCIFCSVTYDPEVRFNFCPHDIMPPASQKATKILLAGPPVISGTAKLDAPKGKEAKPKCTCSYDQVCRTMEGCICGGE